MIDESERDRVVANAQHEAQKAGVRREMHSIRLKLKGLADDDDQRQALEAEHEALRRKFCALHGISAESLIWGTP